MVDVDGLSLPVREVSYGAVSLPEPEPGIGFVVSMSAARRLSPVVFSGADGKPAGCTGLRRIR